MKRLCIFALVVCSFVLGSSSQINAAEVQNTQASKSLKIGFVSVRQCVEGSKLGKSEQESFEKLKKQLEQTIEQKEKELNDLSPKFTDEYLDTLTPEAEKDLKEKFKNLSQDLSIQQNQYFQTLNQANMQVMQLLMEKVSKASSEVAKKMGMDLIMNDEVCFFRDDALDVTKEVIGELDKQFDADKKAK